MATKRRRKRKRIFIFCDFCAFWRHSSALVRRSPTVDPLSLKPRAVSLPISVFSFQLTAYRFPQRRPIYLPLRIPRPRGQRDEAFRALVRRESSDRARDIGLTPARGRITRDDTLAPLPIRHAEHGHVFELPARPQ